MTRTFITIAACIVAALSGSAIAQNKDSFEVLDKNSDGKISVAESAENDALFVAFKSLDTNKDGLLTREEFAAHRKQ